MYGASVEKDFQHIKFENERMMRKLEMMRLLETDHEPQAPSRRLLAHMFGLLAPRPKLQNPPDRSPIASS